MTTWRKSSYSGSEGGGHCVELARIGAAVGVRDSKDPNGPKLLVTPQDLNAALKTNQV